MHDHERVIHPNTPRPDQLRRLAHIGTSSAANRDRLRHRDNSSHYFFDEIEDQYDAEYVDESALRLVRHRMAGRVGVRLGLGGGKEWSLKYFDTFWVNQNTDIDSPSEWLGHQARYRFEWSRSRALLAEKTVKLVGIQHPERTLQDDILQFKMRDDEDVLLHASLEMRQVTADDCEQLIETAAAYFDLIESRDKVA